MVEIITLQTAGAQFGSLSLGVVLLAFLAGMAVPTRYGLERFAGFGRWFAGKLPYKAPPGTDAETAMVEATDGEDSPGEPDQGETGQIEESGGGGSGP
jgi:hypothetical protein